MHTEIFLFKLLEFFKIHLKCIFIIDAFAPMSQNTMSDTNLKLLVSSLYKTRNSFIIIYIHVII
jgi:hypothetical protein